jgi:hypothetical protein
MKSLLGQHPASTLVAIAVGLLAIKLALDFFRGKGKAPIDGGVRAAFFSGALFVNALAHFTHGISGEDFPAPFGYLLGPGFFANLSNVVWGFINIALGYVLLVRGKVFGQNKQRTFVFFVGILAMGIFLSTVFSH